MQHVRRFEAKVDAKTKQEPYKPPVEEFAKDMAIILDHIFSYEFKTDKMTGLEEPKKRRTKAG